MARRISLLVLLLCSFTVVLNQHVEAQWCESGDCCEDCSCERDLCYSVAAGERFDCAYSAELDYVLCDEAAANQHDACLANCNSSCQTQQCIDQCEAECNEQFDVAEQQCYSTYEYAIQTCDLEELEAQADCERDWRTCVQTCGGWCP